MTQNGEILEQLQDKIVEALKHKTLSRENRTHYEIEQMFVVYLKADHSKVAAMWAWFKPAAFLLVVFLTSLVGAIATGRINISFAVR